MRQEFGRSHKREISTHKELQYGVPGTSYSSCGKLKASMPFSQHRRKICLSEKVRAVQEFPVPPSVSEVGNGHFPIPGFAKIAA